MEEIIIAIEPRADLGKGPVGRLRKAGKIPAVVYANGDAALSVTLDEQKFLKQVAKVGPTQIYRFESSDSALNGQQALIKAVQIESLKDQVMHVDFMTLSADHYITVAVPTAIKGENAAEKMGLVFINQMAYEVEVECLPNDIPDGFVLDITDLKEAESLHAGDIELPAGVSLRSDKHLVVVSAISRRLSEKEEAEDAAAAATAAAKPAAAKAAAAKPAAAPAKPAGKK